MSIPEVTAAERIAAAVSPHLQPAWLTERCIRDLCAKVVAHRDYIGTVFAELDADPKRLPDRGLVLQQQATSSLSDEDHILERLHHLKAEESYLNACLTAMGSVYARDYQPDHAGVRDDERREREARQDQAASEAGPRLAS